MTEKKLSRKLLESYEDLGYVERVDDLTARAVYGEVKIEVEPILEDGEEVGVEVFSNGTSVASLKYDDGDFAKNFNDIMVGELNI